MSFKTFSIALPAAILFAFGAIGLFNRIVDPFWYFRDIEIKGFNLDKPRAAGDERTVKPALVVKLQPQAVIVGSSVAAVGLPPTHPGLTQHGMLKTYNLGLARAAWDEVQCLALFAMNNAPVKRLVVGVSGTEDLDLPACPSDRELGGIDYGRILFSTYASAASRETLRRQDGRPGVTREGQWYLARYDASIRTDDDVAQRFALQMRQSFCPGARGGAAPQPVTIDRTMPTPQQGAGLRKLVRLALQKKVELKLLLYPKHVLLEEVERTCRGPADHWNRLWQVVAVVEQETGGSSSLVEVWDFYGYHVRSAERIHARKPMHERLWQDGGHFNEEVGAAVFDAIYSGSPGFGAMVTTRDFDRHVARVETEREAFLLANDWLGPEIGEIARKVAALPPATQHGGRQ